MSKILLSGLGGSLFPYLDTALKDRHQLFYVDSNKELQKLYPDCAFAPAPAVKSTMYKDFVIDLIKREKIDYFIPLIDEELILAKGEIEGKTSAHVIAPTIAFIEICLNKFKLMNFLNEHKLSHIESYLGHEYNNQLNYPIFVKPVSGRGSRGIRKIESYEQLNAYFTLEGYLPEEVLIQPFISGQEYTVGVTTNNFNQIVSIGTKRILSKRGITQIAVTEDNKNISNVLVNLVEIMKPKGPINVQLFLTDEGEIKIFEINPRFSTTSILEIEAGVQIIDEYLINLNKHHINGFKVPKSGVVIHRRWESVFYQDF
jgi:carbamoyl-phosphate synthase large subunit